MLNRWTQRLQSTWANRNRPAPDAQALQRPALTSSARRVEICPPDRLYRQSRWRSGLRDWFNTGWDVSAPSASTSERASTASESLPFTDIRQEFSDALKDIDTEHAAALRAQIEHASSPRELWHLRSALFTMVATHHSEFQAQARMEHLNRHFPNRAPRSGLAMR